MQTAPDRPATHEPLDLEVIWDLSDRLDELREEGPVTAALLEAAAEEAGLPASHAWVAASVDPALDWTREHQVAVQICTGGCQAWGAVEVLERFLEARKARLAEGAASFDVICGPCLNTCDRPTACASSGPHGFVVHPDTNPEDVGAILEAILE